MTTPALTENGDLSDVAVEPPEMPYGLTEADVAELDTLAEASTRVREIFGGPGSGPRPGYKRAKKATKPEGWKKFSDDPGHFVSGALLTNPGVAAMSAAEDQPKRAAEILEIAKNWDPKFNEPKSVRDTWAATPSWKGRAFLSDDPMVVAEAKRLAAQGWAADLESNFGGALDDPDAEKFATSVLNRVASEPKMQTAVERYGPIGDVLLVEQKHAAGAYSHSMNLVVLAADKTARDVHRAAAFGADIHQNALNRLRDIAADPSRKSEGPSAISDEKSLQPWGSQALTVGNGDQRASVRHEYGHHVLDVLGEKDPERHATVTATLDELSIDERRNISQYAAGLNGAVPQDAVRKELFAETFSVVTHPGYDRRSANPRLQKAFDAVEELVT